MDVSNLISELVKLTEEGRLVFFVGAGISKDVPSCIPLGNELKNGIINALCMDNSEPQRDEILESVESLRPEVILQIMHEIVGDKVLDVLDIFRCDQPNQNHFFLAKVIKYGNLIVTTNFDCLIEQACIADGFEPRVCVSDLEFNEWLKSVGERKNLKGCLFKIHGSLEDAKGACKKDTIVATLNQVGRGLPAGKANVFEYLIKNYDMVFIGYSGLDDFDICPKIALTETSKKIFWCQHNRSGHFEIMCADEVMKSERDPIGDLLSSRVTYVRILCDTKELIDLILVELGFGSFSSLKNTAMDYSAHFHSWATHVGQWPRATIIARIFSHTAKWKKCIEYYEKALRIADHSGSVQERADSYNGLGLAHYYDGDLATAASYLQRTMEISEQGESMLARASAVTNLGLIGLERGELSTTISLYESEMLALERTGVIVLENERVVIRRFDSYELIQHIARILNNLGVSYYKSGEPERALTYYDRSLQIKQKLGDLQGVAKTLGLIGQVYSERSEWQKAIQQHEKALDISSKIGDAIEQITELFHLSSVYECQGQLDKATQYRDRALKLQDRIGSMGVEVITCPNCGRSIVVSFRLLNIESRTCLYCKQSFLAVTSGVIRRILQEEISPRIWRNMAKYLATASDSSNLPKLKLKNAERESLAIDCYEEFENRIIKTRNRKILWITNNAGEIVIDLWFIEKLVTINQHNITIAARERPAWFEVTVADVREVLEESRFSSLRLFEQMGQINVIARCHLSLMSGTDLRMATPEFVEAFTEADEIISKGINNWDTLQLATNHGGLTKGVFYVFACRQCNDQIHRTGVTDGLVIAYVPARSEIRNTLRDFVERKQNLG